MDKMKEFVELVMQMRTEQRTFFATRSTTALNNSRQLERQVDLFMKDWIQAQLGPSLFDNPDFTANADCGEKAGQ